MFRNYFTTAYRNLKRNSAYALLNIAGLALGIGCALVTYKVITYELSFDRHHENYDHIYRVVRYNQLEEGNPHDAGAPYPLSAALREDFPSIKQAAIVDYHTNQQVNIKLDNGEYQRYREQSGVTFAEQEVFEILDFDWIVGNPRTALSNPDEVVLSKSWAQKYFGLEPNQLDLALGRMIEINNVNPLKVVGVYEDFPETTDYPFRMVISFWSLKGFTRYFYDAKEWGSVSSTTNCLVLLNESADSDVLERQFPDFLDRRIDENESQRLTFLLQSLRDIHFDPDYYTYPERTMSREMLYALAFIGMILVVTACINFINLATAQAVKRSKEIGIRKVLGGHRIQLVGQFLSETFIITFVAVIGSLGIAELLLINLQDILTYRLYLDLFSDPLFVIFLFGLTAFVGLLSGLYPAFLLSKVEAAIAIKSKVLWSMGGGFSLRRLLVVIQFGISQLLIICTLVVVMQMDYFNNKDLGFNKDAIIVAYLPENEESQLTRLREGLLSNPEVESVSYALSAPTGESNSFSNFNYAPANYEEQPRANFKLVDEHFIELYGLKLIAGRNLLHSDSNAILINLEMLKTMGLSNPEEALGEGIRSGYDGPFKGLQIVGVVNNFHTSSLEEGLDNVVLMRLPMLFYEVAVKFHQDGSNLAGAQEIVEREWQSVYPNSIFDFDFYDYQLSERYEAQENNAKLLTIFSLISIFIGCLGLYGLITFMANQKTKEIGVRKVLGASIFDILKIFSKELIVLLVVAFVIAAPLGTYSMNSWLSNFKYSIELGPELFIISIMVSLVIAMLTMGYRSVTAATANPAESLKDE